MEETKQTGTSEVQQTLASRYCEYRHLNYDVLLEYLTEDVDVEYVAMQIDQTCRHSDKLIRWGTIFRACADSGVFASMQVTKFHKMLANLIPNFKYDRTTIVKGVNEYDGGTYDNDSVLYVFNRLLACLKVGESGTDR